MSHFEDSGFHLLQASEFNGKSLFDRAENKDDGVIWLWARRLILPPIAVAMVAAVYFYVRTSSEPWSQQEVSNFTIALNEAAAISVPHDFLMASGIRAAHLALLKKVESGAVLSDAESLNYRLIFQQTLEKSQRFLSAFDQQLTVLSNHAMHEGNNVNAAGIAGNHDHHDYSARQNFAGLLISLDQLDAAGTPLGRIVAANGIQKDLVDLISHLGVAPYTVSVSYRAPEIPWQDSELGDKFEAMLLAFKAAQFTLVNSAAYWVQIDIGLARYNELILLVQNRVIARTKPWERRIAGRFLSPQTLAPPVDLNRNLRRK